MYVVFIPLTIPYIKHWQIKKIIKLKQEFLQQFRTYLQALATAMGAGYAVENAMIEGRKDIERELKKDAKIVKDLLQMERLLKINVSVEKIWKQWSEMLEIEEVEQFTTVFMVAKRSGGDSVSIIKKAVQNIAEKIQVEQEIYVNLTAKRMEFQVMSCIPMGILVYMRLSFPEFMEALYGNGFGIIVMTVCLLVYAGAYIWGKTIVEIEV